MVSEYQMKRQTRKGFLARLRTNVRGYIVRGLLVIVPLGVTAYVLRLCYQLTAAHLAPFVRMHVVWVPDFMVSVAAVVLFLSILYLIGFGAAWVVGRRMILLGETLLRRIPLVKTVYTASKQAVDVLNVQDDNPSFQSAVMVDFPCEGAKCLAFLTGQLEAPGEGTLYRVFVPTTPNPTSGYCMLFPPHLVRQSQLSVQDMVGTVMSLGILAPERFELSAPSAEAALSNATSEDAEALRAEKEPSTVWATVKQLLRKRMFSGFLVIVPLGVTAFVVNLLYEFTAGRIQPLAQALFGTFPSYAIAITSVVLFFLLLYVVGYVATAVVGVRLLRITETVIERIPFVTTIYSASKQIAEAIFKERSGPSFKTAVFVSFPYPGVRTVGFVVGRVAMSDGETYYKVAIPTTPNVTVGLLQFYTARDTYRCNLTVEEAVKMVVTGGIIAPKELELTRFDQLDEATITALIGGNDAPQA